jgi:hypothetical protein
MNEAIHSDNHTGQSDLTLPKVEGTIPSEGRTQGNQMANRRRRDIASRNNYRFGSFLDEPT